MEDTVNQRINLLIDHFNQGNKRTFALALGVSPQGIYNLLVSRPSSKPSFELMAGIIKKFPEVNAEWLLTGYGPMLKRSELVPVSQPAAEAPPLKTEAALPESLQQTEVGVLRAQIEHLQAQVAFLMNQMAKLGK